MNIPLSLYVPESLASRDGFSPPVLRQPAHHLHTLAKSINININININIITLLISLLMSTSKLYQNYIKTVSISILYIAS